MLFEDSQWVRAEYNDEMIGLCMDLTTAYQVTYSHILKLNGECNAISREDFRACY